MPASDLDALRRAWESAVWAHLQNKEDELLRLKSIWAWRDYWTAAKQEAPSTKRADLCIVEHSHERGCRELP